MVSETGRTVTLANGVTTADPWVLWLAMLEQMTLYHPVLTGRHFRQFEQVTGARWGGDSLVLAAERGAAAYLREHFVSYFRGVLIAETGEPIPVRIEEVRG